MSDKRVVKIMLPSLKYNRLGGNYVLSEKAVQQLKSKIVGTKLVKYSPDASRGIDIDSVLGVVVGVDGHFAVVELYEDYPLVEQVVGSLDVIVSGGEKAIEIEEVVAVLPVLPDRMKEAALRE